MGIAILSTGPSSTAQPLDVATGPASAIVQAIDEALGQLVSNVH